MSRRMPSFLAALALVGSLASPGLLEAQWRDDLEAETDTTDTTDTPAPRAPRRSAWYELTHPGIARARSFVRQGLRVLDPLLRPDPRTGMAQQVTPEQRAALVQNAIVRFTLAHRYDPSDPHLLYLLAFATSLHSVPGEGGAEPARRDDEALALFEELRRQAPEWNASLVAFEIGVLRTRERDYRRAAEEYRRVLDHSTSSPDRAAEADPHAARTTLFATGNLAEVTMLAGDVSTAVGFYERAVVLARRMPTLTSGGRATTIFGLAVALDRLGEHAAAVERASQAMSLGGGLGILRTGGVFFEPEHEIHYYDALGHLAEARDAPMASERAAAREAAAASFRLYLNEGGSESEFASLARQHIERLRETPSPRRRGRRRR